MYIYIFIINLIRGLALFDRTVERGGNVERSAKSKWPWDKQACISFRNVSPAQLCNQHSTETNRKH